MDFEAGEDCKDFHRQPMMMCRNPILTGTGYTIAQWEQVFAEDPQTNKHKISDWARKAVSVDDYDVHHRLAVGDRYETNLLFVRDLCDGSLRTTEGIIMEAIRRYGSESIYSSRAEFAFLLRRRFANEDLRLMGLSRIIVPHQPLKTYGDEICWLRIDGFDKGSNVGAESVGLESVGTKGDKLKKVDPQAIWKEDVAFAFFIESSS